MDVDPFPRAVRGKMVEPTRCHPKKSLLTSTEGESWIRLRIDGSGNKCHVIEATALEVYPADLKLDVKMSVSVVLDK